MLKAMKNCSHCETHKEVPANVKIKDQVDPVCGMNVSSDTYLKHSLHGQTYYFCNPKCLEKFKADPHKYLDKKPVDAKAAAEANAKTRKASDRPAITY